MTKHKKSKLDPKPAPPKPVESKPSGNPSVSIHTITNGSRVRFLELLIKMIANQDYTNIKEWVIGDGSRLEDESKFLKKFVDGLKEKENLFGEGKNINIVFLPKEKDDMIGKVRDRINKAATGDYIICMDDDDYYPPSRISHAVRRMVATKKQLSGSSKMYIFDCNMGKLFQFPQFNENHATHNSLGYSRMFAQTHSYDFTIGHAEEKGFLNNYSEPMVQLEPDKTVIQIGHSDNTVEKKQLLLRYFTLTKDREREMAKIPILQTSKLESFIKEKEFLDFYQNMFPVAENEADIVYYTGGFCISWDPKSPSLTGSEQAIRHLAQEWANTGKRVQVYANIEYDSLDYQGVEYKHWSHFRFRNSYNKLILWRWTGLFGVLDLNVKAKEIIVDLHDNIYDMYKYVANHIDKVDRIMLKSNYHKDEVLKIVPNPDKVRPKIQIVPNGLRVDSFKNMPNKPVRNPYRFVYASCYTRGLVNILENVWPLIYAAEPRAELHCYYGLQSIRDEGLVKHLKELLAQPGVMDHGRQSMEMIIREKYMSSFHFYWTNTIAEIDCISIRESLITGCIPILSKFGVFKERDGIHLDTTPGISTPGTSMPAPSVADNKRTADIVLSLLKDQDKMNKVRSVLFTSKTILSWEDVAAQWFPEISSVPDVAPPSEISLDKIEVNESITNNIIDTPINESTIIN